VVRRSRWTLLDQGELETQEEEAAVVGSTEVEAEVVLTEEKAGDEVVMAAIVAEDTEERAATVVVVAVASAEEAEDAGSIGAEAEEAWIMETEVLEVVLTGDAAVAMVAVVVAAAMVAVRVEDTREVAVVAAEGEVSRMPTDSRSRTIKCSKFETLQKPPLLKITQKTLLKITQNLF